MYIIYQETPSSLLKAAILFKLDKGCCLCANKTSLITGESVHSENFSLAELRKKYEAKFSALNWLESKKSRYIASMAYYALRYNSADKTDLVLTVMLQALEKGPDFVINKVSGESKKFYNRSRRVCMEIHRAYGFVRLTPISGNQQILLSKVCFQHQIHDIVIRYFASRHKDTAIFLIDGDSAYFLSENKLTVSPAERLPFTMPSDNFEEYWDVYYNSQYIEERKNLALARKHIPKKLLSWVPEVNKLK